MTRPDSSVMSLLVRVYDSRNGYIDGEGRYCHRIPSTLTEAEHQHLAASGLTPNQFVEWPHDDTIARLRESAAAADLRQAADAFIASMVSADPAWLTVLPAVALGRAMPAHIEQPMGGGSCRVCFYKPDGIDTTQQAYFRHLQGAGWGGDHPAHGALALASAIGTAPPAWPQPTPRDVWVFHRLLDLLRALPATARYSQARTALRQAGLLRADHPSRSETVLEALAFLGILQTPEHPGLLTRFTTAAERDIRPSTRVEVAAPLAWWTAAHGINEPLVASLFGHLACPDVEPAPPATKAAPRRKAGSPVAPRPKSLPGPPTPGSVYAIRYREDLWGAAYCHEVDTDERGIVRGRVEYLDLLSPVPPTADQLTGVGYRDRLNGQRWQTWCTGLDKTTGIKRIAVDVPAPPHGQTAPQRMERHGARDLQHLAGWHFKF